MRSTSNIIALISRKTLWAEGHVFAITPERFSFAEGLRVSLAMAVMLAAALFFGRIDFAYGAIAAFWNCLCDPLTSDKTRWKAMGTFTLVGAAVMSAASYGASWGPIAGGIAMFVLVLLCGLLRSYKPAFGPMPLQAGLVASLAVIIGIASPRDFAGAISIGAYFLLGSACAILLFIHLWRIPRKALATRLLMTLFGRLEEMAHFLETLDPRDAGAWDQFDTVYRRAVRISIERSREAAAQDIPGRAYLGRGVDAASRVFASLIALGHLRHNASSVHEVQFDPALLAGLRGLLQNIVLGEADTSEPNVSLLMAHATALSQQAKSRNDPDGRAISYAVDALCDLARNSKEQDPTPQPASAPSARTGALIDAVAWRHALRVSVAALVAYSVGMWFGISLSYWGAIAVVVVTQPIASNTWTRVLERACGSFIGGIMAAILITYLPNQIAIAAAIVLLSIPVVAFRLVNYGLFVVFLTPMFMLLSDFIRPAEGLIFARLANELLGAGIGIVASFLLWPENEGNALEAMISSAISANMKFTTAVLHAMTTDPVNLDQLQREAGLASSRLESARERMLFEGRYKTASVKRLRNIALALRQVCGAAAVLQIVSGHRSGDIEARIGRYELVMASLLDRLDGSAVSASRLLDDEHGDDLDAAIRSLVIAVAY